MPLPSPYRGGASGDRAADPVGAMNSLGLWLPPSFVRASVLPAAASAFAALAALYSLLLIVLPNDGGHGGGARKRQREEALAATERRKLAYQLTNLLVNAALGAWGAAYELSRVPPYRSLPVSSTVSGYTEFVGFAAVQLGYQLWSVPVGIFHVKESPAMILHHLAVLHVAFMSAFFANGFRYWTPFFYGLIELSSVPLAIMNMFKDRPEWIRSHPTLYTSVRLVFAGTFLTVRVGMFVPRKARYLRDHYLLWSSANGADYPHLGLPYQLFMAGAWISSAFLLGLQLYWAALIVRGLAALLLGKGGGAAGGGGGKKGLPGGASTISTASSSGSGAAESNGVPGKDGGGGPGPGAPAGGYATRNAGKIPGAKLD
jgi:hypothetical protein